MEMEDKKIDTAAEQALPVQELPADIPAEVRQKLAEDLNEEATEDLKQDMREAEKEEANDEEVKANPEMLTKSRLLKLLIKKQYVKLREVTEEEQPADLAELLEELDENRQPDAHGRHRLRFRRRQAVHHRDDQGRQYLLSHHRPGR